jgi:hypothetical protein
MLTHMCVHLSLRIHATVCVFSHIACAWKQAYPYQNLRYVETAELDEATTGKIVSVKSWNKFEKVRTRTISMTRTRSIGFTTRNLGFDWLLEYRKQHLLDHISLFSWSGNGAWSTLCKNFGSTRLARYASVTVGASGETHNGEIATSEQSIERYLWLASFSACIWTTVATGTDHVLNSWAILKSACLT